MSFSAILEPWWPEHLPRSSVFCFILSMKLMILLLAMLQTTLEIAQEVELTWFQAARLHLAITAILGDVHRYHVDPDRVWVSAVTTPSVQEMAAIAIALLTLILAHVKNIAKWQCAGCHTLTVMRACVLFEWIAHALSQRGCCRPSTKICTTNKAR